MTGIQKMAINHYGDVNTKRISPGHYNYKDSRPINVIYVTSGSLLTANFIEGGYFVTYLSG
jgi:hypothetical protein